MARTSDGRIVGVHNLVRSAPCDSAYEWAAGLVLKEYRSPGITDKIVERMMNELAPSLGIEEVFGEPSCILPTFHMRCLRISLLISTVTKRLSLKTKTF